MRSKKIIFLIIILLIILVALFYLKISKTEIPYIINNKKIPQSEIDKLTLKIKTEYSKYYSEDYIDGFNTIKKEKVLYYAVMKNIGNITDPVKSSDVHEYIKEYFGEKYSIKDQDIYCNIDNEVLFKYKDGIYQFNNEYYHDHDGANNYKVYRNNYVKLLSSKYSKSDIIIKANILYGTSCISVCGPNNAYYKSPGDEEPIIGDADSSKDYEVSEKDYEAVKNKLPVYTFRFKKNSNGSYYLYDLKIK